jgi:hypothetical protein
MLNQLLTLPPGLQILKRSQSKEAGTAERLRHSASSHMAPPAEIEPPLRPCNKQTVHNPYRCQEFGNNPATIQQPIRLPTTSNETERLSTIPDDSSITGTPPLRGYGDTSPTSIANPPDDTESFSSTIQETLNTTYSNLPYGDSIDHPKEETTVQLYFQNIRGIANAQMWQNCESAAMRLKAMKVDICGFAETNIDWQYRNIDNVTTIFRNKLNQQMAVTTSSSTETTRSNRLPGGTLTSIGGKWTGRIMEKINDPSGMGRWSGYKLRCASNTWINILTAYRPTKGSCAGDQSCYQQQCRILRQQGHQNPDPRAQMLKDLQV